MSSVARSLWLQVAALVLASVSVCGASDAPALRRAPRELQAGSWDQTTAEWLATFCAIAYCPEKDVEAWDCPTCAPQFKVVNITEDPAIDMQAYVLHNGANQVVVVWKGTDPLSWAAWASDLAICKLDASDWCDGCELHKGFVSDFYGLRTRITEQLLAALHSLPNHGRDATVFVTGHSLGAALATLHSYNLVQDQGIQAVTYTFGGPRVGNAAFADSFARTVDTMYRVVHDADIVPTLPWHIGGWTHVSTQVYCSSKDPSSCTPMPDSEEYCQNLLPCASVLDHGYYMSTNFIPYLDIGGNVACTAGRR